MIYVRKQHPRGGVTKVPLGEMPIIDSPFQQVAIDLIGPINPTSDRGNRYILTLVDYGTRYPEAVALPKIETERVAEALLEMFCRVGFPNEILSDRGIQFTSDLMAEMGRLIRVKQLFTALYNPACNGLCERMNGTLKSMIKKLCQEQPRDWDRYLPAVLFAYREVPQVSTGFSPFEMLYGRTLRGPMQILQELWTKEVSGEMRNTYQYILDVRNRLEETCRLARESLYEEQGKYKHQYDKKTRPRRFEVGQKVLVLLPTDHNKLLLQWKGPYEVTEVVGRCDYKVSVKEKSKIYHANLLKQYEERHEENVETAAVAVIEPEKETGGVVDDENLLELVMTKGKETYKDVLINPGLTPDQKAEAEELVHEYADIFTDQPGTTNLGRHEIKTTTPEPVRVKPYPMPYAKQKVIEEEVRKMLEAGVIEPANSPYNSPLVLVKKSDGSNRVCVDMRRVNAITKFDTEPMTDIDRILSNASQSRYFSKMDITKGYWQVVLDKESRPLTAFSTMLGAFQFTRMAFGLVNSAATFNRIMRQVVRGIDGVHFYVDDILGHSNKWQTHMNMLRKLFHQIREAGLTVKPPKAKIGFSEVDFVGHIVKAGTVAMDPEKLGQIGEAPRPQNKRQVRAFLGLVGYYRKFVPNFAERATPLTDLTKKGCPNVVQWSAAQEQAFKDL